MKKKREYAVYKGDDFKFMGSIQECADYLKVTVKTAWWYATPSKLKRIIKKGTIIVRTDDD